MFLKERYNSEGKATPEYQEYLRGLDPQDVERINLMSYEPTTKFEKFIDKWGTKVFGNADFFERMDARFSEAIGWNQK